MLKRRRLSNEWLLSETIPATGERKMHMNEQLLAACQAAYPAFLSLWEQLVNQDSGSEDADGLAKVGELVDAKLQSLGLQTKRHPAKDGAFHLTGELAGDGESTILLLAHLDTVFAKGTAQERPFSLDGEWAYGPGVSDCKSGVALALQAVELLQQFSCHSYKKITCFFNCDEEISSPTSKELIVELAKQHDYALCLEPGGVGDGVTVSRKGAAKLVVEVAGKASHAGSDPDKGVNALLELANQLQRQSALGDEKMQTTVTFTQGRGGEKLNVVPDYATAAADVRVVYDSELARVARAAAAIAAEPAVAGAKVTARLETRRPPFPPNEKTAWLAARAQAIYTELGKTLKTSGAGGASDANWAAATGTAVLDSLGPVKGGPNHTPAEKVKLDSVVPRLYLLVRLCEELGSKKRESGGDSI